MPELTESAFGMFCNLECDALDTDEDSTQDLFEIDTLLHAGLYESVFNDVF